MTLRDWKGRVDTESDGDSRRWHQIVQAVGNNDAPGIAMLGFACDEGIRRNGGRVGAVDGPRALRGMLSNLPVLNDAPLYDAGEVHCADSDLEGSQAVFASRVSNLLDAGHFVIGLGGGHEIAYGSYRGLTDHLRESRPHVAIVNLDSHFDLREQESGSSGTPFLQALRHASSCNLTVDYFCLGVSASANTRSLFARADAYGVRYRRDDELSESCREKTKDELTSWLSRADLIYLTVCLDVLPAASAPGVSSPSALGVTQHVIESLIDTVIKTGKVRLCDVAELSPAYDRDHATARLASRLIHRIATGVWHSKH